MGLSPVHPFRQHSGGEGRNRVNVRVVHLLVVVDSPPAAAVALVAAVAALPRTHYAQAGIAMENAGGGADAGRSSPRVKLSGAIRRPGARRNSPRAGQRNGKSRMGVGARRSWPRASAPGDWQRGNQANAAPPGGCVVSDRAKENRVATASVRPGVVADGLPERVETTAPLPLPGSLAAAVGKRPEPVVVSSRRMKIAKQVGPLRQVRPDG